MNTSETVEAVEEFEAAGGSLLNNGDVIALQADTGKFISWMGGTSLRPDKDTLDQYCTFTVTTITEGTAAFVALKAYNQMYLSLDGPVGNPLITVSKGQIDIFCRFFISPSASDNTKITWKCWANGNYVARYGPVTGSVLRADRDHIDSFDQFTLWLRGGRAS